MALVYYEKQNPEFREAHEMLSKGQTYAFRYLLQSFPRVSHIAEIRALIEPMQAAAKTLYEYKDEIVPYNELMDKLKELGETLSDPLSCETAEVDEAVEVASKTPELAQLLTKIRKEFTKTPSVLEVYMKLGLEVNDIEQKRFLKESRVTVVVHPNIDNYPPTMKTDVRNVTYGSSSATLEKKTANSLRPKLTRRTDRQKAEAKLKATGELKREIEVLTNGDLTPIKFEATLFVMNDIIYVSRMDDNEQYHMIAAIPLTGQGFSVSNCVGNTFDIGSRVFDFRTSLVIPSEAEARSLFLLLREVYFVFSPPRLFGASLDDILEREGNTTGVPLCIKGLGEYLMDPKNLQTDGIFRKNGASNKVSELAHILDQLPDHVTSLESFGIHDITATFKKFFMEMTEPLFSSEVVDLLIAIPKDSQNEKAEVKKIMKEHMKPSYFKLTDFLIHVVRKTFENESVTLMNAHALSVCIGPAVIRSTNDIVVVPNVKTDDVEGTVTRVTRCNEILAEIIEDCDFFFK